jgi:hypothetical protein
MQRTYYTARGRQAQVVLEAVRSASAMVAEHNRAHPEAPAHLNAVIASLLGNRLQLICEGGAFAVLRTGSQVEIYPGQPGVERRPASAPATGNVEGNDATASDAGASDAAEVLHWKLKPGDALLLASPRWADKVDIRTLAATVLYVDTDVAQDAADGLRAQVGRGAPPGLLLVFDEAGDAPSATQSPPADLTLKATTAAATETLAARSGAPATPNPLTTPQRRAAGALPTAVSAQPPVDAPPVTSITPPARPAPRQSPPVDSMWRDDSMREKSARSEPAGDDATFEAPAIEAPSTEDAVDEAVIPEEPTPFPTPFVASAPQDADAPASASPWARTAAPPPSAAPQAQPGPSRGESVGQALGAAGAAVGAGARTGFDKARSVLRDMLPEQRPDVPADFVAVESDDSDWTAASGSWVESNRAADAPTRAQPFQPPPPSTGGRARLFILIALLLALLVPVVVGGVYWRISIDNRGRADSLVSLAQARLLDAQKALEANDSRTALNFLSEAEDYAENATELVGASGPLNDLLDEIRGTFDDASNVQPLYALGAPLISFAGGASPTRLVVQDQEIYVLDPGRSVVERYRLDATQERVPDGVGAPLIRTGDQIDGARVGDMIDIAWVPPVVGFDDRPMLVVLDDENQVFGFDPRVEGPGALKLMGTEAFGRLRQIESFTGRLYLADAGVGQMWRYPAGQYDQLPPSPWFAEPLRLDELTSLRIDGEVWLLMRNGQVLRYREGAQLPFSLDQSVGMMREPVDLFVGDGTNPYLYVADGGSGRIWVFDKEGVYQKQLAAPEGDALRGLSGLFIEDVTDSLFLLTSSALFKHPLPRN